MRALLPRAPQRLGHNVSVRYRLERGESIVLGFALVDLTASGLYSQMGVSGLMSAFVCARSNSDKAHLDSLLVSLDLFGEVVD
jgi:hypothetical protein